MTDRVRRLRRDLRDDAGFTLIELLVTMTLAIVVLFAVLQGSEVFARSAKRSTDVTQAQDAARSAMRSIIATIRTGRLPTAAQAGLASAAVSPVRVADATAGDLVVATNVPDATGTPTAGWTRYCADGAGSLMMGRLAVASFAAPSTCGVTSGGWTYSRVLDRTLRTTAGKLFQFDSATCVAGLSVSNGSACAPPAGTVTTVGVLLNVAGTAGSTVTGASLRDAVSLRNGSPS